MLRLDTAACHAAKGLKVSATVVLVPLPLYRPARNPIARLWNELKGWIAGQGGESVPALPGQVAELFRGYRPPAIRSLTGYAYILEAVNDLVL